MLRIKKILFPVDLSEGSTRVAAYVKEVGEKFEADIHCIFVARVMEHYAGLYVPHPSITSFEAEIVKGAEKKLQEFVDEVFQDRPVEAKVVPGDPAEEILNYARSEKMDLIVMGTHGRKGIDRIIFGSVAEHIVKKSPIPVLSVNPYIVAS